MATRIRLRREGRKGQSYFRIVVADSRSPRDGRFVAMLGHYNPRTNPADLQVNAEQARAWLDKGALPTDTVRSLLKRAGVFGKRTPPAAPVPPAPPAPPTPPAAA
jgi:small subunit ribosomal protein S16